MMYLLSYPKGCKAPVVVTVNFWNIQDEISSTYLIKTERENVSISALDAYTPAVQFCL